MYKIWFLLYVIITFKTVIGIIEITNLKCTSLDKTFTEFDYCYIKAVNRSYKYVNLKASLYQLPVDNVSIGLDLQKKANGYRPFLYNIKIDACKFLKNRKSDPVANYFYGFFGPVSNMNHTCPYLHDLIVEKMDTVVFNNRAEKLLPFPEGEYAVFLTFYAYEKPRANISIFLRK